MLNPRRTEAGLSLVELMIGIAVGLFIVAAATLMTTSHLDDNRRLLLETQVQQDLRAAADLITRDLRRAGRWDLAASGVWSKQNVAVLANPNSALTDAGGAPLVDNDEPVTSVEFAYDGATDDGFAAGFLLDGGAIELLLGDAYQQVTDPATLTITTFNVTLSTQTIDLSVNCLEPCSAGPPTCPTQLVRTLDILLVGEAANDNRVRRSLRSRVRLPNDLVVGQCPVPP